MTAIPGPGLIEVTMGFSMPDGELAVNVFGVDSGGTASISNTDLTQVADVFKDWWQTGDGTHSYRAFQQSSGQLIEVKARDLGDSTSLESIVNVSLSGTDGGEALPNGVTFTLTARTGLAGRSQRGRTFLAGLSKNFLSAGDVNVADSAHAGNAVAAFDGLLASLADITLTDAGTQPVLAVFSRVSAGIRRAAIAATPIIGYGYHDLFMDYQRRRAPGHNRHH